MLNLLTPLEETKAYQSIFAKGEARGRTEGKTEGKTEAKVGTLCRQLTRRFGPLPLWATQLITAAPESQLDTWLDDIFEATSVQALLGEDSERH